jgi:hypothetical protein
MSFLSNTSLISWLATGFNGIKTNVPDILTYLTISSMIPTFSWTAFSPHPHFILVKRSVGVSEAKVRPEMPFEPTPQDLLQEAELL